MPWVKTKEVHANILQRTWRELGVACVKFLQTADYEISWNQLAFSETRNLNNFKTNQTIHVKRCEDVGWEILSLLSYYIWNPSHFRDNLFVETGKKFIESFSETKNQNCVVFVIYRTLADDVLFQKHFTDLAYLDWFSRYERFCEPWYL